MPEYMDGMRVEVIDIAPGVGFDQKRVKDRKLRLSAPEYGYLAVRLYE